MRLTPSRRPAVPGVARGHAAPAVRRPLTLLPTETLTFLFTDIEGSTALLQRLGDDAYGKVLRDHHRLIRAGLAAHGGEEISTQGDGFFAVFSAPGDCVASVIETQRALAGHPWPAGEKVRVRMGVHSGKASKTATGLVGLDVHRAARVVGVAHGGQVLLSEKAADLVRDSLPPGASLRDLGHHRLKDLGRPEPIFQLQAEGLEADFASFRSLGNTLPAGNLPEYPGALIGREAELAEARALIESSRLVTLTGAGGSGKTRLALQVASELLDQSGEGVSFADLAVVTEAEQVPGVVAAALGIRPRAGRQPLEALLEVLADQNVLIVLDNCEHVIDACANLVDLINRSCPRVHLLVTSREPLGIDGERVYRVLPLSLAPEEAVTVAELEGSDAVALFVVRARAHDDTFVLDDSIAALVASICRRLDGIPFAIELAAARLASMSLAHLSERLDQRFRLLTGGTRNALPRQRTLQATVDWSYDLLSAPEQAVLRRLSVFVGSFELDAAEAVCATCVAEAVEVAEHVGSLVNKSLVVVERSSGSLRYRLLETIREYAAGQLAAASGEAETRRTRLAHADYYLQLSEAAAPELTGAGQGPWLKRLDLEWENIRASLASLVEDPDRTEALLRLGVALHRFLLTREHVNPIRDLQAALERPGAVEAALRARALYVTGYLVANLLAFRDRLELGTARDLLERALDAARELDDTALCAETLAILCWVAYFQGESRQATLFGEEAVGIARDAGDPRLLGVALMDLAHSAPTPEEERALRLEALACFRQAGDVFSLCTDLRGLAIGELAEGRLQAARDLYEEAIAAAEEIGSGWHQISLWQNLGFVLLLQGELERATILARQSLIACRRRGSRLEATFAIFILACCATRTGESLRAAQLLGAHDVIEADVVGVAPDRTFVSTEFEQRAREENRESARRLLGDDEFERAYGFGRGLSFDEAIDLALGSAHSAA
jgi:predicted ATPase/class 3 adenylate cyclase